MWRHLLAGLAALCLFTTAAHAARLTVDPGAFLGQDLTNAYAGVTLTIADPAADAQHVSSDVGTDGANYFAIQTAAFRDFRWGDPAAGFGARGIFRADFAAATDFVSVLFGSAGGSGTFGVLEAYDSSNNLIGERLETGDLGEFGNSELLSISRPTSDIAFIKAYGENPYALVRELQFEADAAGAGVPEPSLCALLALGLVAATRKRTRAPRSA